MGDSHSNHLQVNSGEKRRGQKKGRFHNVLIKGLIPIQLNYASEKYAREIKMEQKFFMKVTNCVYVK